DVFKLGPAGIVWVAVSEGSRYDCSCSTAHQVRFRSKVSQIITVATPAPVEIRIVLEASASPVPSRLAIRNALTPVGQAEVSVTTAMPSGGSPARWQTAKTR